MDELPPLPSPNYEQRWNEAKCGIFNVVLMIGIIVGLTHALPLNDHVGRLPRIAWWMCFVIIHTEAGLALICLERVLNKDPGIVKRSEKTCLPVPDAVAERLKEGRPLDDLRNVYLDENSYCVRCCVWRPKRCHHCSTCQRCVTNFDHHCGFYGRCIAGTCLKGNMPYFAALILLAWTSIFVLFVFTVLVLIYS